ncbi:alpha/beta hydrolase [Bifidobacterium olomucense]|uniref:Phospholipase/Carboxylesterase n=1 Tax=Bifidobacterium olomucense TaxID=2675324 RepID=A0A7Y0F099_9BIFI|nr:prolyl oligopeptidase family serine peptidase [Bifidobacterium sp. DSM 109959]NMM98666.1 phospholipase/Carboxylesterase [Bifidobacterium sp. DSM 109959]
MKISKALTRMKGNSSSPVFVLLHGWGSNEYDLPDILNYCGAGSADYASLQAPIAYGMGYTWFGDWAHEGVPEGASLDKQAAAACQAIDAWVSENIPSERPVAVMGFSQGGLLAGHMLRMYPERYTAAISCSGWLAPGPVKTDELLSELKPAVFYGHGSADDIFPKADVEAMSAFWNEHGTLTERIYPGMAHSINMPELRDIQRFLESNGLVRPQIW